MCLKAVLLEAGSTKFQSILLRIHEVIDEEGLKPGDRIPSERELVSRLQVGRSTVREALRALELLGIITTRRGQGTFLQPYRSHRLVELLAFYILRDETARDNLLEMRMLLETGAVRLAALRAREEDLHALEGIWSAMKKKVLAGEVPVEEDYEFHRRMVQSSHNHLLLRVWYPVIQYGQTVRENSLNRCGRPQQALQEHRDILDAIRERNPRVAERRLEAHLSVAGFFRVGGQGYRET
ncbi:GntR family transcriptional regulator [Kroppenstedtia guangzhouensis]|uniref:GntR family transcriptional regulator n=1 Tax=Kroppenstedtia guangzhouensis TaxID=1274356 RepID=A0ABQ1GX37_9BACL|nr:FadR/GntR family transcriptional regulator [Kroppenstedtia guangzhouensis]GGA51663.1 GntR family transcriptional regulator [Kroppenstedtia guangzhouensis]